jgi:hypothetical protein
MTFIERFTTCDIREGIKILGSGVIMLRQLQYERTTDYAMHRENIFKLHKRNYGWVPEKRYDSHYVGNPYGEPFLGLCYDGENLIGQENYIFQQAALGGQVHKCAMGVDTIVDPKYRIFYGVFKHLIEITMDPLKGQADFLYAFANEDSKKYYLKYFNWKIAEKVDVYKKVVSPSGLNGESLLAFLRPGKSFKDFALIKTEKFKSELLDEIIDNHRQKSQYTYFHKTTEYLQWRFMKNTFYRFEGYIIQYKNDIRGYLVTFRDRGELKVADFLISDDDPDMFLRAMLSLVRMGSEQGLKRLVIYAAPNCWYLGTLKKLFFFKRWTVDFIAVSLNGKRLPDNWVINMGDFDVL